MVLKSRRKTPSSPHSTGTLQKGQMVNPNTHAFVASPEIVTAMAIAGDLTFNPMLPTASTNEEGNTSQDWMSQAGLGNANY
jgi:aconitase A